MLSVHDMNFLKKEVNGQPMFNHKASRCLEFIMGWGEGAARIEGFGGKEKRFHKSLPSKTELVI